LARNSAAAENEGEAGIHFPHTPFSARPARASGLWRAPRAISSVQKRFGFRQIIAPRRKIKEFMPFLSLFNKKFN